MFLWVAGQDAPYVMKKNLSDYEKTISEIPYIEGTG